jgi:Tfp pilus assembly protein FimT
MSQTEKKKVSKYYNFGSAWASDDGTLLSVQVDWTRNQKQNKGQGYKLFLVPVDDTGAPSGESVELSVFRLKPNEKRTETSPDYQVYSWE